MKNVTSMACGIVIAMGLFAGCDGGGGGGGSLMQRCESWCARRNMDMDCGPEITSCSASCTSIIASAGERCESEAEALFACFEAEDDICDATTGMACLDANNTLTMCTNAPAGDAGP